jgi:hypothetical protein
MRFKEDLEYTSRGIQYKPLNSRFKYILKNFDDSLITDVKRVKYSSTNKFLEGTTVDLNEKTAENTEVYDINCKQPQPVISSAPVKSDLLIRALQLQKTDQPDVYKLFEGDSEIGIASVSTMKTSKMLRRAFTDVNLNEKKLFDCEYSEEFKKWVPIALKF